MKKILPLFLSLLLLLPFLFLLFGCAGVVNYGEYPEAASYTAGNFTCAATAVRRVEIDWLNGSVLLEKTEGNLLSAEETSKNLSEAQKLHWRLEEESGTLSIRYAGSGYTGAIDSAQKALTVRIPEGIDVRAESISAPLTAQEIRCDEFSVRTVSGNTTLTRVRARRAEASSTSGKLTLQDCEAEKLLLDTVSGKISATMRSSLSEAEMKSTSGDITLSAPLKAGAEVRAVTVSGSLTLSLPGENGMSLSYRTTSGSFRTGLPYRRFGGKYLFDIPVEEEAGERVCTVWAESVSGDLTLQ